MLELSDDFFIIEFGIICAFERGTYFCPKKEAVRSLLWKVWVSISYT